jgi:WD40 repeat protein
VWRTGVGPPVAVLRGQHARILDLGFGPTSDRVAAAGDDGMVRLWDAGRTQAWTVPSLTYDAQLNRNGRSIVTGSADGTVRVWNPRTGELRASLEGPDGSTIALFSPTADTVVIRNSSRARLWPVAAKSATVAVQLPKGRAMQWAELDGTGKRLLYVDDAGHVVVRALASGRDVPLEGGPKKVNGAVFSPDGRYVAAAPDRGVVVWRVDSPARPVSVLRGHRGPVNALDISRDDRILSAGADGTLRVWDTAGHQLVTMGGNADEVTTAVFTPDGEQVLSSGQDGSLRLFDARSGQPLAVLRSPEGELYDVALSRDGNIATLGRGEVVRVFPCDICGSLDRVRAVALSRSPRPLTAKEREQFLAAAQ